MRTISNLESINDTKSTEKQLEDLDFFYSYEDYKKANLIPVSNKDKINGYIRSIFKCYGLLYFDKEAMTLYKDNGDMLCNVRRR